MVRVDHVSSVGYDGILFSYRSYGFTSCSVCLFILAIATCNSVRKASFSGGCPAVKPYGMMMVVNSVASADLFIVISLVGKRSTLC